MRQNPHVRICGGPGSATTLVYPTAFRRLYRQRGRTDGVALQASLRTAAPLVGVGIDRIIHAHYVDGLSSLQLVARAKVSLATVGTKSGPACTRLLNVCKT